jgi:hypothetical protein
MTSLDIEREDLLDDDGENRAVRSFLMQYSCDRSVSVAAMRRHMQLSGWDGCWPEWANDSDNQGHLTKGGAQDWLRHLFSLEPAAKRASQPVPSGGDGLTAEVIEKLAHDLGMLDSHLHLLHFARAIAVHVSGQGGEDAK